MPSYKQKKARLKQLVKRQEQERINKIQNEGYQFKAADAFRIAEKHYKFYMHRETDYSKVLQPAQLELVVLEAHQVYKIKQPEGAYLIKGFIDLPTQMQIGFEALNDYVRKPYRTNLDGTNGLYLEEPKKDTQNEEKKFEYRQETEIQNNKKQLKIQTTSKEQQQKQKQAQRKQTESVSQHEKGYFFNENIRMANLGYQYDWPHRSYPKTEVPIPQTVRQLTRKAQKIYQKLSNKQDLQYHGEAVIVNYYKPKDYMIGHLDDGQEDQINPIFSFCFGLSCIFLLGFPDKQLPPLAIKLEAGDLLIMSGFSRICYHGVPRIIQNSYKQPEADEGLQRISEELEARLQKPYRINGVPQILNFFKQHRLNLNIRQVWNRKGEKQKQQAE